MRMPGIVDQPGESMHCSVVFAAFKRVRARRSREKSSNHQNLTKKLWAYSRIPGPSQAGTVHGLRSIRAMIAARVTMVMLLSLNSDAVTQFATTTKRLVTR